MSIKKLYSAESLDLILKKTLNQTCSDDAFSAFQRDHLQTIFKPFRYDFCSTSIVETDGETGTLRVEPHILGFDAPKQEILESYLRVAHHDDVSRMVYANPGRVFLYTDLWDGPPAEHAFFREHCQKYDIHKAASIGYKLRNADEYFIAFDYMANDKNPNWYHGEMFPLEYASFPFALAWLCRSRRIGPKALTEHLTALADLTVGKLEKLRRYINRNYQEDLTAQAKSLGLSLGGYDDPLYKIRDKILSAFGESPEKLRENGQLRLESIEPYCDLLKMMGDSTCPIIVPDDISLTESYYTRMRE